MLLVHVSASSNVKVVPNALMYGAHPTLTVFVVKVGDERLSKIIKFAAAAVIPEIKVKLP